MKGINIKNKKLLIVAGIIIGLTMMLLPQLSVFSDKSGERDEIGEECGYYSEYLEKKLTELISCVGGVENVRVVVTLEGGSEYVYAANTKTSENGSTVDYIVISGKDGEGGLVVGQLCPRVRGVAVVCGGGSSAGVRKDITQLLAAALGISTSRIMVCGQE